MGRGKLVPPRVAKHKNWPVKGKRRKALPAASEQYRDGRETVCLEGGAHMARWVMVIDLTKCNGCESCVAICTEGHQLPPDIAWRRIVKTEVQFGSTPARVSVPLSCMHCGNPPCRDVCPTGATHQHEDGIVDIDQERCIGCGYCVVACPYLARTIVSKAAAQLASWIAKPGNNGSTANGTLAAGVCTKCNMCRPKIEAGLAKGLTPGSDPTATPSCVLSCPWGAIHFGDANDPESAVSLLLQRHNPVRILEELGTDPSVYYINADVIPDFTP